MAANDPLHAGLSDRRLTPADVGYDEARRIWTKAAPAPRQIVRCRDADEVRSTIATARSAGLPLSVRGGGHDWAGRAMCEGIVIDLRHKSEVIVAPDGQSVRVGGGATAKDVTRITDPLGVAPALGSVGDVGVGGLTLGGGYGPLIGRCGLASDNLIGAQVVLADGRIVNAGDDGDADLLWALRGGGGNFGVVTEMTLRLHKISSLTCGTVVYALRDAAAVIARLATLRTTFVDALTFQLAFITAPDGTPALGVVPYWSGAPGEGEAQIAPFLTLAEPLFADVKPRTFSEALSLFDGPMTDRHYVHMETCWIPEFDASCIDVLVQQAERRPSPGCAIVTHQFHGAAEQVRPEETAFGFRRSHTLVEIVTQVADPAGTAERAWAMETIMALAPFALPGAYANLLAPGDPRAGEAYGPNAARLRALKDRYDPNGLFSSVIPLPLTKGM